MTRVKYLDSAVHPHIGTVGNEPAQVAGEGHPFRSRNGPQEVLQSDCQLEADPQGHRRDGRRGWSSPSSSTSPCWARTVGQRARPYDNDGVRVAINHSIHADGRADCPAAAEAGTQRHWPTRCAGLGHHRLARRRAPYTGVLEHPMRLAGSTMPLCHPLAARITRRG
jgi:hypothetical protein